MSVLTHHQSFTDFIYLFIYFVLSSQYKDSSLFSVFKAVSVWREKPAPPVWKGMVLDTNNNGIHVINNNTDKNEI